MSNDPRSHGHAQPINDASFPFEVLRADVPVLVDFHAEWCGACQQLSPVLDDLAGDYAGRVKVTKVDVEAHPATAERLGMRGISRVGARPIPLHRSRRRVADITQPSPPEPPDPTAG